MRRRARRKRPSSRPRPRRRADLGPGRSGLDRKGEFAQDTVREARNAFPASPCSREVIRPGAMEDGEGARLGAHIEGAEAWFRERLRTLVEHRTVSPGATDRAPIRAGAEAALRIMQDAGAIAELVECSGTPSVLARFRHPEPRARIVVYNHLDVQPAERDGW